MIRRDRDFAQLCCQSGGGLSQSNGRALHSLHTILRKMLSPRWKHKPFMPCKANILRSNVPLECSAPVSSKSIPRRMISDMKSWGTHLRGQPGTLVPWNRVISYRAARNFERYIQLCMVNVTIKLLTWIVIFSDFRGWGLEVKLRYLFAHRLFCRRMSAENGKRGRPRQTKCLPFSCVNMGLRGWRAVW
jgi:hypothetical protein